MPVFFFKFMSDYSNQYEFKTSLMKLKNIFILTLVLGFSLISIKGNSQNNYKHWFTESQVYFYYEFVPKNGSTFAYYNIKAVNGSRETKSIYYNPVFQNERKQTSVDFAKRNFTLRPGKVDVKKYIVDTQSIIQSGGKVPAFNFLEYSVKTH